MKLLVAVCLNRWWNNSESFTADLSIRSMSPETTSRSSPSSSNLFVAVSMKLSSVTLILTLHPSLFESAWANARLRASFTLRPNGKWKIACLTPDAST